MALKNVIYITATENQTAIERFNQMVATGSLGTHTYDPEHNDYRVEDDKPLPTPTSGDAGKVVCVGTNMRYSLTNLIPAPTSTDIGKYLKAYSTNVYQWAETPNELPVPSSGDSGKMIVVNNSNQYELITQPNNLVPITTAPTSDNTTGMLKFVFLDSEPATRYNGYIYFIAEEE